MKKHFLLFVIGFLGFGGALSAQDAESVVRASRNRLNAKTTLTRSRMVITAKNSNASERVIDQYSKDDPQGRKRTVIEFQRPASVKGSRFLTMENAGKTNDQWIFLPSLGKVRRIAASEGGGSFMGTDFSYDDIASSNRDAGLDMHAIIREESLNGVNCYVIESRPKDSSYQYGKMISWIGKADSVSYKVELYDKKDILTKTLEMSDFQLIQGRLTAKQTKMSSMSAGSFTVIYIEIIKYDDNIPEGFFTVKYLETGKP
jgi:hypothetical protein